MEAHGDAWRLGVLGAKPLMGCMERGPRGEALNGYKAIRAGRTQTVPRLHGEGS